MKTGKLIGVGVGPGDPELLTVKAVNAIKSADVVAYFSKEGNKSNARRIVEAYIPAGAVELPLPYPLTIEVHRKSPEYRSSIGAFFEEASAAVAAHLDTGRTVAVLSAGDPFLYGSYMHLHMRLRKRYPAEVIPGVSAMAGCWSVADLPIVQGDDILTVLPGTLDEEELVRRLKDTDAAVIMKVGQNLPKIRKALTAAGKMSEAVYVERGTMSGSRAVPLADAGEIAAPYFSVVLVPGWQEQP